MDLGRIVAMIGRMLLRRAVTGGIGAVLGRIGRKAGAPRDRGPDRGHGAGQVGGPDAGPPGAGRPQNAHGLARRARQAMRLGRRL